MTERKDQEFDGKAIASRLPTRPGVYLMRDDAGKPLYVGKARNLRKRVTQLFRRAAEDRPDHADDRQDKADRGQPDPYRR